LDPVAKEKSTYRQVHQYDKIIRENLEAVLPGLIRKLLGINAVEAEELPDDIQHTKERQPDVLKKIRDEVGDTYVLHIEFQVSNEPEMVYRMAEYFVMLSRRYKLEVRQYVIYLGSGKPSMATQLRQGTTVFQFQLINLSEIDYRSLLKADDPRFKMLAILGDFKGASPGQVVKDIAKQVIETSDGDFAGRRHVRQLKILMKLRNLVGKLVDMDSLAPYMSVERDVFYHWGQKKGLEKGETKKATRLVKNLLLKTDFSIAKIAELAEVTEYFVRKIKKSLN
jgi:hypothetical protein